MFICEISLVVLCFPQFCTSDTRSTDISKCFSGSLRLRDNESRLYYTCLVNVQFHCQLEIKKIKLLGIDSQNINRIYDGVEAETRNSQASFQII